MKILQRLFVVAVTACSMLSASADNYKPANMRMWLGHYSTSSSVSQEMTLLGENADGQQIWACNKPNPSKNNLYARWSESGAKDMSANEKKFEKNKKYSISTSFNDVSYEREVDSDTTALYVVKPTSSETADLFIWDGKSNPDFIKEFYIVPRVMIAVDNVSYDYTYSRWIEKITYTIAGVTSDAIDHVALEYCTSSTPTDWQHLDNLTDLSGSYTVVRGTDTNPRYYRIVVHLKDKYKVFAKDGVCTPRETGWLSGTHTYPSVSSFDAAAWVTMNTGVGTFSDIEMTLLGSTNEGYQIWSCNNSTGAYGYTYWHYGDGTKYSSDFTSLGENSEIYISADYTGATLRQIPHDASKQFFFRKYNPYATNGASVFCWDMSSTPSFIRKYYINGYFDLSLSDPVLLADEKSYIQHLCWSLKGVTEELFDKAEIQKSVDGGKSWTTLYSDAAYYGNAYVEVPTTQKNVRFRAIAYPKSKYRVVVEHGCWTSTSANKEMVPTNLSCSVKASAINPADDFVYDSETGSKSFKTTVEWSCSDNMTALFGSGTLQYSIDKGKNWGNLLDLDSASGSAEVTVPVGCTAYLFRVNIEPSSNVSDDDRYRVSAVSDPVNVTYDESELTNVYLAEGTPVPVEGYNDLSSVPLTYKISKTLWQLCDKAYFTYSFDYYQTTGHALQGFIPNESGTAEVIVPNNIALEDLPGKKGGCTIGLEIYYTIDGESKTYKRHTSPIFFPDDK